MLEPTPRESAAFRAKEREAIASVLRPPPSVASAAPTDCWPQLFICHEHCVVETCAGRCDVCTAPLQRWSYCETCDDMHHEDLLLRESDGASGKPDARPVLNKLKPLARHCAFAQLDAAVRRDFEIAFADKLSLPEL